MKRRFTYPLCRLALAKLAMGWSGGVQRGFNSKSTKKFQGITHIRLTTKVEPKIVTIPLWSGPGAVNLGI